MPNAYCVRADYGTFTQHFLEGGYAAIGWNKTGDLSNIKNRDELYPIYNKADPFEFSNIVIGQQVGQIARFLWEIKAGDYVITPAADSEWLHFGQVAPDPSYWFEQNSPDG